MSWGSPCEFDLDGYSFSIDPHCFAALPCISFNESSLREIHSIDAQQNCSPSVLLLLVLPAAAGSCWLWGMPGPSREEPDDHACRLHRRALRAWPRRRKPLKASPGWRGQTGRGG